MLGLELACEFGGAHDDGGVTGRPALRQTGIEADDFTDGSLRPVLARAFGEVDSDAFTQLRFEGGVVDLGGGNVVAVQRGPVEREPLRRPVRQGRGNLVRDRDVGVQVRISGARIAMGERCGDQSVRVDLRDTAVAETGEAGVLFEVVEGGCDRGVVRCFDLLRDLPRRNSPQRRHTLHGREREVETGDGFGVLPPRFGDPAREFTLVGRAASVLALEHLARDAGADRRARFGLDRCVPFLAGREVVLDERLRARDPIVGGSVVDLECATELDRRRCRALGVLRRRTGSELGRELLRVHRVGLGVQAVTEQRLHVRLGDVLPSADGFQLGETGPGPAARRLPLFGVVLGQ